MAYARGQLLYGYKWTAVAASDNPYYTRGTDYSEINKSEGYEVLYFINHLATKFWPNEAINVESYQKIEKILKNNVPDKSTHKQAEDYIRSNWSSFVTY